MERNLIHEVPEQHYLEVTLKWLDLLTELLIDNNEGLSVRSF